MKLLMIASGSRGDIQPYVALGRGLVRAGHHVRIVTNRNYEPLVTSHGLDFHPIEVNVQDFAMSQRMREVVESGSLFASMTELAKGARRFAGLVAESSLAAVKGMDLVLGGISGVFPGLALAEKTGIPFLQAYNLPITPSRAFPGVLTPAVPPALNRLSGHLTRQVLWQVARPADAIARTQVLGLRKAPFFGPYASPILNRFPVIYGFSQAVIPRPADWDEQAAKITGFWELPPEDDWSPPPDLLDFLEAGPQPVYIGFGSMSTRDPRAAAQVVFEALDQTGLRAVVSAGWEGLAAENIPANVYMIGGIPHSWLFPRMRAVVHHGGAGTTAAGLAAGLPSIIVPHHGDQPFWGRRVAALGIGPEPIPRNRLSANLLAAALKQATSDRSMISTAAACGKRIQSEDGVREAVALIEQIGASAGIPAPAE